MKGYRKFATCTGYAPLHSRNERPISGRIQKLENAAKTALQPGASVDSVNVAGPEFEKLHDIDLERQGMNRKQPFREVKLDTSRGYAGK